MRICSVEGCAKATYAKGLCQDHWRRLRKYGDPTAGPTFRGAALAYLHTHVNCQDKNCLIWPYATDPVGYGVMRFAARQQKASRVMCILAHGAPPHEHAVARHRCDNPVCVNPRHLEWGTHLDNVQDAVSRGRVARGIMLPQTKLSHQQVLQIFRDDRSQIAIAEELGLDQSTISDIKTGRNWAWLTGAKCPR